MKTRIIFTTLLIEKSPQALPLGAACVACAVKSSPLTKDLCNVQLKVFNMEDDDFRHVASENAYSPAEQANSLAEQAFSTVQAYSPEVSSTIRHAYSPAAKYIADQLELCAGTSVSSTIFCFSVFVWNADILHEAAKILRAKGAVCIAGGPEITAHPHYYTGFNYTVCGEGERNVPELLHSILADKNHSEENCIPAGTSINGNSNCKKEEQNCSVVSSASVDLDSLESPYLSGMIDPAKYGGALWELARGCPFKCAYCYESKGEKKVRLFPMERIEKELDLFAAKKIPQVFVLDPTYNINKKRAVQILQLIAKKTPGTFYYFEARAEYIDRELARAFTKIPCALQIGLQSANEQVLQSVNRSFDKKKFIHGISILNDEGVTFGLDLIYGLPGESFSSFKDGIDFAISLFPNNLEIFCLSVLPGTDLADRATQLELTFETTPPYHVLKTGKMAPQDLERAEHLAASCSFFYNDGRAVPWMNSVCKFLKIKPSKLFQLFYEQYGDLTKGFSNEKKGKQQNSSKNTADSSTEKSQKFCKCQNHHDIEKIQLEFLKHLFEKQNGMKYFKAAGDIIRFYGALARTEETGISEEQTFSYNAEYLASQYASDIKYFCDNIRPSPCKVKFFRKNNHADFKIVK